MLSNRLGRLLAFILSLVAAVIVLAIASNIFTDPNVLEGLMFALFIVVIVAAIHQFCGDLLNFEFMDNIVFRTIKRILFFGAAIGCTFIGVVLFYENGGYRVPGEFFEELFYCMMVPSGFVITILCMWADGEGYDNEKLPFFAYYSLIPSLVIGLILALIGPSFYVAGGVIICIAGLAGIVLLIRKYGLIYGDGPSYTPKKTKQQTGLMPAVLFNRLSDNMKSIISRHVGSKYVGYGIKVVLSAYHSIDDYNATITVNMDVYMHGCTATSDYQVESAAKEALAYQKQAMQKMYNGLEEAVNRLLPQYNYNVNFNYGVQPGTSLTHE